jgi:hypothetical protein
MSRTIISWAHKTTARVMFRRSRGRVLDPELVSEEEEGEEDIVPSRNSTEVDHPA